MLAYKSGDVWSSFDKSDNKVQGKDDKFSCYLPSICSEDSYTKKNNYFFVCEEFAEFVTFNILSVNVYQGESLHYLLSRVVTDII